MGIKGGYKIIDLHNTNIVSGFDGVTIPGIYEHFEDNYRKMLIVSRFQVDGVEIIDTPVIYSIDNDNFVFPIRVEWVSSTSIISWVMTVTKEDKVTVNKIAINIGVGG